MFKKREVYKCSICGKEEPSQFFNDGLGTRTFMPDGWAGSYKKHEQCFCKECTQAIKQLKGE